MKLNNLFLTVFFLFFIILLNQLSAQELKKSVNIPGLDLLMDEITAPVNAQLNFNINRGDIEEPLVTDQKKIDQLKSQIQKQPDNLTLQKELLDHIDDRDEKAKHRDKLIQLYKTHLGKNKQDGEAFFALGEVLMQVPDYQQAYEAYSNAYQLMPDSAKTISKMAFFALMQGNYTAAKFDMAKALKKNTQILEAQLFYVFAQIYEQLNKGAQNLQTDYQYLDKLTTQYPKNSGYQTLKESSKLLNMFYNLMLQLADKYSYSDESDPKAILESLSVDTKELQRLKDFYSNVLKLRKGEKSMLYDALGVICIWQKQYREASDYFDKAVTENQDKDGAYYNHIFVQALQENWKEAEIVIQKKIAQTPTAQDYALLAGLKDKQDLYKEGIEICSKALVLYPDNSDLLLAQGILAYHAKDYKLAQKAITQVYKQDKQKNDKTIPFVFAVISLRQGGNPSEIKEALKEASLLESPDAEQLLKEYFE